MYVTGHAQCKVGMPMYDNSTTCIYIYLKFVVIFRSSKIELNFVQTFGSPNGIFPLVLVLCFVKDKMSLNMFWITLKKKVLNHIYIIYKFN